MTARRRSDKREFIFLTVDMPQHPTFYGVTTAAKWLYVVGLTHAGRHLTDGLIPVTRVVNEAEVSKKAADELVARAVPLLHEAGRQLTSRMLSTD